MCQCPHGNRIIHRPCGAGKHNADTMTGDGMKLIKHHHELRLGLLRAWDARHNGDALAECLAAIQSEATHHQELLKRNAKVKAERESAKRKKGHKVNRKAVLHRAAARLEHHLADASALAPGAFRKLCMDVAEPVDRQSCCAKLLKGTDGASQSDAHNDFSDQVQAQGQSDTCTRMLSHGQHGGVDGKDPSMAQNQCGSDTDGALPAYARPSIPGLAHEQMGKGSRISTVLQLDLISNRHVRAEVRAKLIAKALCNDDPAAAMNHNRRLRPRSTPAAFRGRARDHQEPNAVSTPPARRVQTAYSRPLQPRSAMRLGRLGSSLRFAHNSRWKQQDGEWDVGGVGLQIGPPPHAVEMSSPRLAAPVACPFADQTAEADALDIRMRPLSCGTNAPRGAILYYAALELHGQAGQHALESGAVQPDCGSVLDAAVHTPRSACQRPKSAKTLSSARLLQVAEPAEGPQPCSRQPQHGPSVAKTRMLLRDTMSAPSARRRGVHPAGALAVSYTGGAVGLDGSGGRAGRLRCEMSSLREAGGAGGRVWRRQRAPSAVESRYLRESVLESSLRRRSKSAARQRARSATLGQQMKHLLGNLERVKPELRQPTRARAQFDEELPEWDRWRSLILIPTKSFQIAQRPIRSE